MPELLRSRMSPNRAAFAGIFVVTALGLLSIGATLPVIPRYVQGPIGAGDVAVGSSPERSRSLASHAGPSPDISPTAAAAGAW